MGVAGHRFAVFSVGFLALAACDEGVTLDRLEGKLAPISDIDFGAVQVGIKKVISLDVTNSGTGALIISRIIPQDGAATADYEFRVPIMGMTIGAGQTETVPISFQPFAETDPLHWGFDIEFGCTGDTCERRTVKVTAIGVQSGLKVEPNPIDFGTVLIGSTHELEVKITNELSVPVDVKTEVDSEGRPKLATRSGTGRFALVSPIKANRSILPDDMDMLAPAESITVVVRYVPDPARAGEEDLGRWIIANCDNPLCDFSVPLKGTGTNTALTCEPEALLFGDVNPESTVTLSTRCVNAASETINVTGWFLDAATDPSYTVESYMGQPSTLPPGADFVVDVSFTPDLGNVGRRLTGALEISGRNPRANRDLEPTRVALEGQSGGPDIQVIPEVVNFGQVALGTANVKRVFVENVGYSQLDVSSINVDLLATGHFTSPDSALILDPGEGQVIEIAFEPTAEAAVMSEALFVSNDNDEPELTVPLRGAGVSLPPCSYTLTPADMNFGIVQILRSNTQALRIRNTGDAPCLINDLEIAPGSSGAFRLTDGNQTGVMLPPGQELVSIVEYTPQAEGVDMGQISFYISDPANPNPTVTLRGVGSGAALLISPNELNFGRIGLGCATSNRTITIYNTGSQTTRIRSIEIPPSVSAEFELGALPSGLPQPPGGGAAIAPGQSIDFTVRYRADDYGFDSGFLHIFEQGTADPYVVPLYGEGAEDPINEDRFQQLENPEVDILFVIDNSCSMSEEQAGLAGNFQSFIQYADAQALDYQISVVATDMDGSFAGPTCANAPAQRPGAMPQGACGYFADGNGAGTQTNAAWRIVQPGEQPSPEAAFGAIATQGIDGSGTEQGLEAAYRALSSPLITGWNNGFLRQDAYLAMVFLSDEEDQSPQSVDFYVNYFRAIKGFRNTHLFSASAIVGDVPGGCGGGNADPGARYVELANRTGGIFESICTSDWSTALQNLGLSVFGYKSRFFLSNTPVRESLGVWVNGVQVQPSTPSGQLRWSYDPATNSVNFPPLATPEPGTEIVVRYLAECL